MFIKNTDLKSRLDPANNLIKRLRIADSTPVTGKVAELDTMRFKNDGTPTDKGLMDMELRSVVAAATIIAGPAAGAEIGECSESYAEVLARGEYSSAKDPEQREKLNNELREGIYQGLSRVRERAQKKLMLVLKMIDADNLEAISPKDRARLAAQMANQLSSVIDRTIQKDGGLSQTSNTHLHLYAPERRPLAAFDIKRINQDANAKSNGE